MEYIEAVVTVITLIALGVCVMIVLTSILLRTVDWIFNVRR